MLQSYKSVLILRLVLNSIVFMISVCPLLAQNQKIDSLKAVLNSYQNLSKESLNTINHLFEEHYYMGNKSEATRYADLLIEQSVTLNHPSLARQCRLNKAWTLLKVNKEKGKKIVKELLLEAKEKGDTFIKEQCYIYLGSYNRFYITQNMALIKKDFAKVYSSKKEEVKAQLSIENAEQKVNVKERTLKAQLDIEKEQNIKNHKLLSTSKLVNKLLLVASIFFLFLIGQGIKQLRAKRKENQAILQRNKNNSASLDKIKDLNISLTEKNNLLKSKNKVKNQELLDFITFKTKRDNELNQIKNEVDQLIASENIEIVDLELFRIKLNKLETNDNNNWFEFKQKLEELYPKFFSKLSLLHPNLTENDKFHCAYILLDMSVKVVAEIKFLSQTTVNSTRYRIKKKMGFAKNIKLKDYLFQISNKKSST